MFILINLEKIKIIGIILTHKLVKIKQKRNAIFVYFF